MGREGRDQKIERVRWEASIEREVKLSGIKYTRQ